MLYKSDLSCYISYRKLENSMDLLIISEKIKSHNMYIIDFNKFTFNKTKTNYTFVNMVYCVLAVKEFW